MRPVGSAKSIPVAVAALVPPRVVEIATESEAADDRHSLRDGGDAAERKAEQGFGYYVHSCVLIADEITTARYRCNLRANLDNTRKII